MITYRNTLRFAGLALIGLSAPLQAQVHYEFLKKATGPNGYVWYKDDIGGGADDWADMGRTGAAGIFTIPKHSLVITGKAQPGVDAASAPPANGLAPEITALSPKSVSWAQEAKLSDLEKAFISAAPADRKDGISVGKLENNEAILTFAAEIAAGKHGEIDSFLLCHKGTLVFESYYRRGRINYGFFCWVDDFRVGEKTYHCLEGRGAGGQFILMFPELDLTAVITAHDKGMGSMLATAPNRILPVFIAE